MADGSSDGDRLTNAECAAIAGVNPGTWRYYVARGYAPAPDGRLGRTPWWWRATVEEWMVGRPGRGARTDLRLGAPAWKRACPYWQSQNGGPTDLPGAHGPGTCLDGCRIEPKCMT